jgi:hypothetical protein
MRTFKIQETAEPQTWRMVRAGPDDAIEEVVFTLRGIVCSKDLPPFLEKPSLSVWLNECCHDD